MGRSTRDRAEVREESKRARLVDGAVLAVAILPGLGTEFRIQKRDIEYKSCLTVRSGVEY